LAAATMQVATRRRDFICSAERGDGFADCGTGPAGDRQRRIVVWMGRPNE